MLCIICNLPHNKNSASAKYCKDCLRKRLIKKSVNKERLEKYNVSEKDYENMLQIQNNKCAICGVVPNKRELAVDHCHISLKTRGLLCTHCNMGLGYFKDSPKLLSGAAKYLLKYMN